MNDSVLVVDQFITDCVNCAIRGSRSEIIACLITITVAAVVRHFEKKRIEKRNKK